MLKYIDTKMRQKRAMSSSIVTDELKKTAGGFAGEVKYVLNANLIRSIFQQEPILRRAFDELVTSRKAVASSAEQGEAGLTETEFWIEYFKSKFFLGPGEVDIKKTSLLDKYYVESQQGKQAILQCLDYLSF